MLSRRSFLHAAASGLAVGAADSPSRVKLREFGYTQVALTQGPIADMYRRVSAHFLRLDEDRLLKVYRQRAGLTAPGRDMGGWYDANGFVPGHLIGQFVSGLSRIYACTGEREAAAKARRLVLGYAAAFEKDRDPFANEKAAATWGCYVLDKYAIGMLDAASLAGVPEARTLLPRIYAAGARVLPDRVFDRVGVRNPPYDEPYILPENLFKTHTLTGDRRFLDLGNRYLLDAAFFDPLANGENVLPGKHGYSHVIALSSAAKAYEQLGNDKHLRAIRNAWDMIADTQQYASGGWAADETFVKPRSGELASTLTHTRNHFETPCCFYAHAKLARYLTMFTGDAKYADGLERALYNTILGALDPDEEGGYFYYSDYQANARKGYYKQKWPCCAGTLLQSVADFPLDLYFEDPRGVYVNLYAGSELRWRSSGVPVKLTQTTAYPESQQVSLRIDPDTSVEFALRVRIPGWMERPARVSLNGKSADVQSDPGTYATIFRRWRKGDTVEVEFPFPTRALPVEEKVPETIAILRGPVMLVAVDPPENLVVSGAALPQLRPAAGAPLEFDCSTVSGPVRLRPFYRVQREPYTTYVRRADA